MNLGRQKVFSATPISKKSLDAAGPFARALACHRFGQLDEAWAGYKQVLKKRPNHFDALHMLGLCEHHSGNTEVAARLLWRALLLDPQPAAAHSDLATVLIALQRLDKALAHCDQAIALKADFVNAHYNRGTVLSGLRRFTDAVGSFDRAIAIAPHHTNAMNNRATRCTNSGDSPRRSKATTGSWR